MHHGLNQPLIQKAGEVLAGYESPGGTEEAFRYHGGQRTPERPGVLWLHAAEKAVGQEILQVPAQGAAAA